MKPSLALSAGAAAPFALSLLALSLLSPPAAAQQAAAPADAASLPQSDVPAYLRNYQLGEDAKRRADAPLRNILKESAAPKPAAAVARPAPPPRPIVRKHDELVRELDPANPNEAPGRIHADDTAFLRLKDGDVNGLAVTLTNQRTSQLDGAPSPHKNTNALRIAAFGEYLLRGPSQNAYGFAVTPKARNTLGFNSAYIDERAVAQNVALFDYDIHLDGSPQNPSAVNDHRNKHSTTGIRGLQAPTMGYAFSDSGALDDPTRALRNGQHRRHVVAVFPQDGVNGHVYTLDELRGAADAAEGQLAWHPYADKISFNANDLGNERYEWKIRQRSGATDGLHLSLFMPTAPSKRQQFDGLFFDEGRDGGSFVGRYLFNSYALPPEGRSRQVLTMFYPRKQAQAVPTMERISARHASGATSQAAAFVHGNGVTDFVVESAQPEGSTSVSSPTLDPAGTALRGRLAVYRRINRETTQLFVAQGREFGTPGAPNALGFRADTEVDIALTRDGCVVSAPKEVRLIILRPGRSAEPSISVNGAPAAPVGGARDWLYLRLPAGTHTIDFAGP